jgi:MFS family permease
MPLPSSTSTRVLFAHRPFLAYFLARTFSELAYQVAAVAVGWQIYALTDSAFALGLVGLMQFIPTLLLTFVAGRVADRYHRARVVALCQIAGALTAGFLVWGSIAGWLTAFGIFAAVVMFGATIAFESPAAAALLPGVVPEGMLQKGTAITSGAFQVAMIGGPALGGVAYAVSPALAYALMALGWLEAAMLNGAIKVPRPSVTNTTQGWADWFAGIAFVRRNPAVLGTISLDLFAVLLGGATALLPIYARDILHTGPWGLGVLRAAPAAGALLMATLLGHYAINRRVGLRMLQAVVIFGVATVVFALSKQLWVSVLALAVLGAADTVSMVIRISLVQLATPDDLRGRVGAVNYLFVNASYQLGEFESGVTAALFGTVPAVVLGGIGTIIVALLWMRLFPSLRDLEKLE